MKKTAPIEKKKLEAPKPDGLAYLFGTATLVLPVWSIAAAWPFLAGMLGADLSGVTGWIYAVAALFSGVLAVFVLKRWLTVFYLLKPRLLTVYIFLWHLTVFIISKTIIFNVAVGILFAVYAVRRCEIMGLADAEIVNECGTILKRSNNALYMAAMSFFAYEVRTTGFIASAQLWTGFNYWSTIVITGLIFLVAVFGFVRLQQVISLNIIDLHFHPGHAQVRRK